jgi:hypothetical protein
MKYKSCRTECRGEAQEARGTARKSWVLQQPQLELQFPSMKMRASELSSAAVLPDGSMSIGFRSATDSHTLELSRKAQEQLLPALLASEPANLRKFFTATDVQAQAVAEGVLLSFPIRGSVMVRILVPETSSHQLLALLTGWARRPEPAADDSRPSTDGTASEQ